MNVFLKCIPFPQQVQYMMLKAMLDENLSAGTIAKRLGKSKSWVRNQIWRDPAEIRIDDLAIWMFACGGRLPKFEVIPRD